MVILKYLIINLLIPLGRKEREVIDKNKLPSSKKLLFRLLFTGVEHSRVSRLSLELDMSRSGDFVVAGRENVG